MSMESRRRSRLLERQKVDFPSSGDRYRRKRNGDLGSCRSREESFESWIFASRSLANSWFRGPSKPANIDRCIMIRRHRKRAGSQTRKIRGTTVEAQTERWDEVRGGFWSIMKPMREGAPRTPTRSSSPRITNLFDDIGYPSSVCTLSSAVCSTRRTMLGLCI